MIGITVTGTAYAAIVPTLPAGSAVEAEILADRDYRIWLPETVVNQLRSQRTPGESFSAVILRLAERGSFAGLTR
jgi:hypothetical protein